MARATSAATSFFEPITFGGESFVDGATASANNPIDQLWSEAADVFRPASDKAWKLEDNIRCLISVGTGKLLLKAFDDSVVDIGKALVAIATDTEQKANTFQTHHTGLFQDHRAFRFNVTSGLEQVGLEEQGKLELIVSATRNYVQVEDTFNKLEKCVEQLEVRYQSSSLFS